ncbi:MAG: amidohydrolase family protein [Gammaproteobacteria bacterium]
MTTATANMPAQKTVHNPFPGETLDSDGHVYLTPEMMRDFIPEVAHGSIYEFLDGYMDGDEYRERRGRNRAELWETKGIGALGAYDPQERLEALDMMGIRAQLMFPNHTLYDLRGTTVVARNASRRYNDFALDFTNRTHGRCRAVCAINMSDVDFALAEAKRVLDRGAKAVNIPVALPPAGVSPSHSKWDPLWAMLAEANVPAMIHLSNQGLLENDKPDDLMLPHPAWRDSEVLRNKPAYRAGGEEAISPYFMLVAHMAPELYLQTMVMGKVFERHPNLRFGITELGSTWLGPCVERMDLWSEFMAKVGVKYAMKPSEYVRRNVRVAPFWHEDVPRMIERYGLKECYCFSSDYPHLEGSRDPFGKFGKQLERLPASYAREFFVDNSRLLMPDA